MLEHLDSLMAFNCTTKVYEAGRQMVLETKKKNVHAFILAENFAPHGDRVMLPSGRPMRYNPYRFPHFYTWDENDEVMEVPKNLAQITLMTDGKVIINNQDDGLQS